MSMTEIGCRVKLSGFVPSISPLQKNNYGAMWDVGKRFFICFTDTDFFERVQSGHSAVWFRGCYGWSCNGRPGDALLQFADAIHRRGWVPWFGDKEPNPQESGAVKALGKAIAGIPDPHRSTRADLKELGYDIR